MDGVGENFMALTLASSEIFKPSRIVGFPPPDQNALSTFRSVDSNK